MRKLPVIILLSCIAISGLAQKNVIATIKVAMKGSTNYLPVSINLDSITHLPANELSMTEELLNKTNEIPCQVENSSPRRLYWEIPPSNTHQALTSRSFKLIHKASANGKPMDAPKENDALIVRAN